MPSEALQIVLWKAFESIGEFCGDGFSFFGGTPQHVTTSAPRLPGTKGVRQTNASDQQWAGLVVDIQTAVELAAV